MEAFSSVGYSGESFFYTLYRFIEDIGNECRNLCITMHVNLFI